MLACLLPLLPRLLPLLVHRAKPHRGPRQRLAEPAQEDQPAGEWGESCQQGIQPQADTTHPLTPPADEKAHDSGPRTHTERSHVVQR